MGPKPQATIKHAGITHHATVVRVTPRPQHATAPSPIPPPFALIAIFVLPIVAIIGLAVATKRAKRSHPVMPAVLITLLAIAEPFIPPFHFSAGWIVIPCAAVIGAWLICAELKRENLGEERQERIEHNIARGLVQGSPRSRALTVSANLLSFLSHMDQKRIAKEQSAARFGGLFGSLEGSHALAALAGLPSPEEVEAREFCKEYFGEYSTQVRDVYELLKHGNGSAEIEKILDLINPTAKDVRSIAEWLEQVAKTLP